MIEFRKLATECRPLSVGGKATSAGRFDPRPVLMIHLPGQQVGHEVSEPFDEIRIHDIIERTLRGQDPGLDKALLAGAGLPAAPKP
jgi:hypothetical protein